MPKKVMRFTHQDAESLPKVGKKRNTGLIAELPYLDLLLEQDTTEKRSIRWQT